MSATLAHVPQSKEAARRIELVDPGSGGCVAVVSTLNVATLRCSYQVCARDLPICAAMLPSVSRELESF